MLFDCTAVDTSIPAQEFEFKGVIVLRGRKGRDSAVCVRRWRIMDVKAHQTRRLKMHERPPKNLPLPPQNRAITDACYLPEPPGRKW